MSDFTFRINTWAAICGQTSHQLTPIFRITAQSGFSIYFSITLEYTELTVGAGLYQEFSYINF